MTGQYFENSFVKLHYYKFGNGPAHMLCFHGFGMHGKQFIALESALGHKYTFWGFDLFFHQGTELKDQSLQAVKQGIKKQHLTKLIKEFCDHENIQRFSVIGYSMGSHYATAVVEGMPERVNEYIIAAPSSINSGPLVKFFSKNKVGNKALEKLMLNKKALINLLRLCKWFKFIDESGRDILYKEIGTPELRFALYACFTYLRYLETDERHLISSIEKNNIRSIFIFGKHDKMYRPRIGKAFFKKLNSAEVIILDENHEMIKQSFVSQLSRLLA